MITYKDILKAINQNLKSSFPQVPIQTKDIKEGFLRPSFFVEFENLKASDFMNYYKERSLSASIYFFPSDSSKNKIELLETMSKLEDLFLVDPLRMNDNCLINITESDCTISDGVLVFNFDLTSIEKYEDNCLTEMIENLEVNINKG